MTPLPLEPDVVPYAEPTQDPILDTALQIFSWNEIDAMTPAMLLTLTRMIERRLVRRGPPPSRSELLDLRRMMADHFWLPNRGRR